MNDYITKNFVLSLFLFLGWSTWPTRSILKQKFDHRFVLKRNSHLLHTIAWIGSFPPIPPEDIFERLQSNQTDKSFWYFQVSFPSKTSTSASFHQLFRLQEFSTYTQDFISFASNPLHRWLYPPHPCHHLHLHLQEQWKPLPYHYITTAGSCI